MRNGSSPDPTTLSLPAGRTMSASRSETTDRSGRRDAVDHQVDAEELDEKLMSPGMTMMPDRRDQQVWPSAS
jgi:hypothetical protein